MLASMTCTVIEPNSSCSSRNTPPSSYYKKSEEGSTKKVWTRNVPDSEGSTTPLFTAAELAPTYHDGANGGVLGCPHYSRSCKLRHPTSGRLYTCRLCCAQERENPLKEQDSPLDRYAVKEILCMRCTTLQPANEKCINQACDSKGARFAKYYCQICHLYDDDPEKQIYHCPFCNVCRSGRGLGIDYRHCMRCNACVSLEDTDHHCIPQRLQATCPICHESMFQSTEPLKGLKCGHVLHLSCFTRYMRGQSYTCPLCKKSVEDMREYFTMLDAAVRMQPMPAAFLSTVSEIYCQDCGQSSKVPYHFVGCKCAHCGSYNTRELGRTQLSAPSPTD
uniref:RING finger and CHY zinc finger domain-containing protein 1 n=1 Tax=Cyclophora tenuis TaxID=216820 RepID=A0A7S1GIX4_CYCTE